MVTSYIKTLNENNKKSLDQEITVIWDETLIASNSPSAAALAIVTDPETINSAIRLFEAMGIALMPGDTIIIPATIAVGGVYILYRGGKFVASVLKERKSNIQEQAHKTLTDIPEEPKLESFPLGEEKKGEILVTPNTPLEKEQEYIPNTTPQKDKPESIPLNDGNIDEKGYIFTSDKTNSKNYENEKPNKNKVDKKANSKLTYERAPYHPVGKQLGKKAPAPTNGQKVLDESVRIKELGVSERRVGIDYETGEIVVFDKTINNIFHGHVVSWKDLRQEAKNALIKNGLTTPKGKIIENKKVDSNE